MDNENKKQKISKNVASELSKLFGNFYLEDNLVLTDFLDSIMIALTSFLAEISRPEKEHRLTRKEFLYMTKDYCIKSLNDACSIVMTHEDFNLKTETKDEE